MANFDVNSKATKIKNAILLALREQPLYSYDMQDMFNIKPNELRNYINSLRNFDLIEQYEGDMHKNACKRRWTASSKTAMYDELLLQRYNEYLKSTREKVSKQKENKKQPHIREIRLMDTYRPLGNKNKISPWFGYQANGGL